MSNSYFAFKQFTVHQDMCAMKVGTDGTLLGAWAAPCPAEHPRILDAGTGTGLIAMMMAQRFAGALVTGVEIDGDAAMQAKANAAGSPFAGRIEIINAPLQSLTDGGFDLIVCNPPYFTDSLKCPDEKRSMARHASTLTYGELASHAARLLAGTGILAVIVPAGSRSDMDSAAAIAGLHPRKACAVRTKAGRQPKRYMLAYSVQHCEEICTEELVIGDGRYNGMLKDFYLAL